MGLLKNLKSYFGFASNYGRIRTNTACISEGECEALLKLSQEIEADKECTPKIVDQSLHETVIQGAENMKNDGFAIASEEITNL